MYKVEAKIKYYSGVNLALITLVSDEISAVAD